MECRDVHSPKKALLSKFRRLLQSIMCQSLLSIPSNSACRLSCCPLKWNSRPKGFPTLSLMSFYSFYLFTDWTCIQWRLILAWQILELEKDVKGSACTPWTILVFGHCRSFASMSSKMSHFPCGEPQTCGFIGPKDPSLSYMKLSNKVRDKWWEVDNMR